MATYDTPTNALGAQVQALAQHIAEDVKALEGNMVTTSDINSAVSTAKTDMQTEVNGVYGALTSYAAQTLSPTLVQTYDTYRSNSGES